MKIVIARGNKSYDVSSDVISGSIVRRENAVSSASFQLSNKDMQYNGLFERMGRVMIYMKRVTMVQVFAGYLDSVPHKQLYGGVVKLPGVVHPQAADALVGPGPGRVAGAVQPARGELAGPVA